MKKYNISICLLAIHHLYIVSPTLRMLTIGTKIPLWVYLLPESRLFLCAKKTVLLFLKLVKSEKLYELVFIYTFILLFKKIPCISICKKLCMRDNGQQNICKVQQK